MGGGGALKLTAPFYAELSYICSWKEDETLTDYDAVRID